MFKLKTLIAVIALLTCVLSQVSTADTTWIAGSDKQPRNARSLEIIEGLDSSLDGDYSFVVVGDSRTYPKRFARIAKLINSLNPDFVIHLGDIVTTGSEKEYKEVEPIFDSINAPVIAVPGNHDYTKGKNGSANYNIYFGDSSFTFDFGGVRFVLVDNAKGYLSKTQLSQMKTDLTTDQVKVVMMHAPPKGPYPKHYFEGGAKELLNIIRQTGCEYAFFAHIHGYDKRTIEDKCTAYITGGGGAEINGYGFCQEVFHVMYITVKGRDLEIKMIPLPEE